MKLHLIAFIIMENSEQIFSLWIGKNSQQIAHHFYALQAEQFFDESQDPTHQSSLWKLYDIHEQRKKPYFLVFDTEIPHLSYIRRTNHGKVIAQMQKSQMKLQQYYFPLQYKKPQSIDKHQQKDKYLYQRWEATESNYSIIDKNFIQDCDSFDYWKDIFRSSSDTYQDKVRKHLQSLDFLKYITFSSDLQKNGFSQQVLTYIKDQCPKKDIFFFQIEETKKSSFYEVSQLQSLSQIGSMTETFVNINIQNTHFSYFESNNQFLKLAPLFNSLFTPLCLKNNCKENYLSNILINPSRNIFDVAFTLPIIDKQLNLSKKTNIFDFLSQNRHQQFFSSQQQQIVQKSGSSFIDRLQNEQLLNTLHQNQENRINYGTDYLGIYKNKQKIIKENIQFKSHQKQKKNIYEGLISEAYVLKGHVNCFDKIFEPNCELLDLKYLQGILCNYNDNKAKYSKAYTKAYGQTVVNYPFHSVLFQHKNFGDYLREMTKHKNKKIKHQLQEQWKQDILVQADYYKQIKAQEDQD